MSAKGVAVRESRLERRLRAVREAAEQLRRFARTDVQMLGTLVSLAVAGVETRPTPGGWTPASPVPAFKMALSIVSPGAGWWTAVPENAPPMGCPRAYQDAYAEALGAEVWPAIRRDMGLTGGAETPSAGKTPKPRPGWLRELLEQADRGELPEEPAP